MCTSFPKYAALAILQKRPTSTTPVNSLVCFSTYNGYLAHPLLTDKLRRTTYRRGVQHFLPFEGGIDDKVTVIGNDRTSYNAY